MKNFSTAIIAILCLATTCYSAYPQEVLNQWLEFKQTYGKSYNHDEEHYRLQVFIQNLEKIPELEKHNPEASYGVTKFADLTEEEFASLYLTLQPPKQNNNQPLISVPNTDIPSSFDWRNHSAVTDVKDQGLCGSCWAFSAIANIEGQYAIKTKNLTNFSEQELVDCDDKDQGCNGGYMWNAFSWLAEGNGLEKSTDYPYFGFKRPCGYNPYEVALNISGYYNVSTNETTIAETLVNVGPLSTGMNAKSLQLYRKGVYKPRFCDPTKLDHGVTIVGYGTEQDKDKNVNYWIIKNSWGPNWGEQGYFKILRGEGTCGINTAVCTAQIKDPEQQKIKFVDM